jgi:flagellar motility protein MotE (MotC chaperone)
MRDRMPGRIRDLILAAGMAIGVAALLAGPTLASSAAPATQERAQPAATTVPGIPEVQDIDALAPIPLRREISRAEGRISDLRKERAAELAGLDAAAAEARSAMEQARATPQSRHGVPATGGTAYAANTADAAGTAPLLNADTHAQRRREIDERYARLLAKAEARLERLLDRQAVIDPDAPDQRRLRHAGNPDTAAHWPEPAGE